MKFSQIFDSPRTRRVRMLFSKIGSEPILEKKDFVEETLNSIEYLKSRTSKQVIFTINVPKETIYIDLNPALHSWTIENLVKNAIDAMKGKGKLDIIKEIHKNVSKIHFKFSHDTS